MAARQCAGSTANVSRAHCRCRGVSTLGISTVKGYVVRDAPSCTVMDPNHIHSQESKDKGRRTHASGLLAVGANLATVLSCVLRRVWQRSEKRIVFPDKQQTGLQCKNEVHWIDRGPPIRRGASDGPSPWHVADAWAMERKETQEFCRYRKVEWWLERIQQHDSDLVR